jgi:hypothetical protein
VVRCKTAVAYYERVISAAEMDVAATAALDCMLAEKEIVHEV